MAGTLLLEDSLIDSLLLEDGGGSLLIESYQLTDDIPLFMPTKDLKTEEMGLFISTFNVISSIKSLFIKVPEPKNDDLFLSIDGCGFIDESLNLFLKVANLRQLDLTIKGSQPPPTIACPDLDPLAAIQIGADLITIYQERIDSLINQLGKNVLFIFDPIIEPCTNCVFDIGENRSTGIYKIGGPIPFTRGQKCPYCKGQGFLERAVEKCVKCLIKWNPKEFKNYGISVQKNHAVVRLKGFLTDAPHMVKAKTAIVDHDIERAFKLIVRLIQGPIPVGLREDRYCVSYWELIDS